MRHQANAINNDVGGAGIVVYAASKCSVVVSPGVSMNLAHTDNPFGSMASMVVMVSAASVATPKGPLAVSVPLGVFVQL